MDSSAPTTNTTGLQDPLMQSGRSTGLQVLLFILLWGTFAFFQHTTPGWNVNSRLSLTYALVEHGTVRIDDYWNKPDTSTEDVANFKGHYYSDKIIGASLSGVPAFAGVKAVELLHGSRLSAAMRRYLVTTFSIGLMAALSGVLLFRLLRLVVPGTRDPVAFLIAFVTLCGTQLLFYSTLYMSYLPAQFFLLAGIYVFERNRALGKRLPFLAAGVLLGLSVLCEYTYAVPAGLYLLYSAWNARSWAGGLRCALGMCLALSPFLIYTVAIFGHPSVPYAHEINPRFQYFMARGFMGATVPRMDVLYLITIHPFRGLFVQSPVLIVSFIGFALMLSCRVERAWAVWTICAVIVLFAYNSAYYMWWGGWSFGPRHLCPVIPLLAFPIAAACRYTAGLVATIILAVPSLVVHTVVNALEPQFKDLCGITLDRLLDPDLSDAYPNVFAQYIWPLFTQGTVDRNAGWLLGLRGPSTLLPLICFWIVAAVALVALSLPANRRAV